MEIDLGGLAKEYAADSAVSSMRNLNVTSAMIELAGDVATIGDSEDATPWRVGIQDPEGTGSVCAVQLSMPPLQRVATMPGALTLKENIMATC